MTSYWISTEDWHTAGEPFRIVANLPPIFETQGKTVSQRRLNIIQNPTHPLNTLRQSLCHEPRGHADMYGGFITPPDDPGALFGVLFWHKDGFSTACGHGTIALGYWVVVHGILSVPEEDGVVDVVIDVPSGRVKASVTIVKGRPVAAEFVNVLSYQFAKELSVRIPSRGVDVVADLAFAGAVFASVDASQLDLDIEPRNHAHFITLARETKTSLGKRAHHGFYGLYAVIFFTEGQESEDEGQNGPQNEPKTIKQKSVTVFAEGQIDRSPCGSGTCARLAILQSQGRIQPGRSKLLHRSIIGSSFEGDIVSEEDSPVESFRACIPRVRGQAHLVGRMSFFIDTADPLFPGFLLG